MERVGKHSLHVPLSDSTATKRTLTFRYKVDQPGRVVARSFARRRLERGKRGRGRRWFFLSPPLGTRVEFMNEVVVVEVERILFTRGEKTGRNQVNMGTTAY